MRKSLRSGQDSFPKKGNLNDDQLVTHFSRKLLQSSYNNTPLWLDFSILPLSKPRERSEPLCCEFFQEILTSLFIVIIFISKNIENLLELGGWESQYFSIKNLTQNNITRK